KPKKPEDVTSDTPIVAETIVTTEEIIEGRPEITEIVPDTKEGEELVEEIVSVVEIEGGKRKVVKKVRKPKKPDELSTETPIETETIVTTEEIIEGRPEITEIVPETKEGEELVEEIVSVEEIE